MVDDPYRVLGVSRGAAQDEIKRAYRKKAKEYHPDLHPDDPDAARKMNEVNEAYDMLQNPEKYEALHQRQRSAGDPSGQYARTQSYKDAPNGQGRYRGSGGWSSDFGDFGFEDFFNFGFGEARVDTTPRDQAGDPPALVSAIRAVNEGRASEALRILSQMTSTYRNARWYYVCAVAYHSMGDTARAQDLLGRAIQMDPNNRVYTQLYREYRQQEQSRSQADMPITLSPLKMFGRVAAGLIAARFFFSLMQMLFYGLQYSH